MSRRFFIVYRPNEDGKRAAQFAERLAASCEGELHVLLPVGPVHETEQTRLLDQVAGWISERPSAFLWERTSRQSASRRSQFLHVGDPLTYPFGDAIVVDNALVARRDVTVLAPRFEFGLFARALGPALMPIGNRASSRHTVDVGLPLLRAFGFGNVFFYHTTWPADGVVSDRPADHIDTEAGRMLAYAERRAGEEELGYRTFVRMDPKVSDGIVTLALDFCPLIVMAHSLDRFGATYVDEVVRDSPIPVLAIGRPTEVK